MKKLLVDRPAKTYRIPRNDLSFPPNYVTDEVTVLPTPLNILPQTKWAVFVSDSGMAEREQWGAWHGYAIEKHFKTRDEALTYGRAIAREKQFPLYIINLNK